MAETHRYDVRRDARVLVVPLTRVWQAWADDCWLVASEARYAPACGNADGLDIREAIQTLHSQDETVARE